jgi:tRNA-uridine 2-sulfurtransferase
VPKAIALISGGLDSLLAARVVRDQGVEVRAVIFDSGFFSLEPPGQRVNPAGETHPLLRRVLGPMTAAGIPVDLVDVSAEFFRMLRRPAHGFGSHVNPCIDCKILFLRTAKARLGEWGGNFLITGEVLGQRPMSQNAQALRTIERDSGCQDLLLRPLCARNLAPTLPEREGWVDRAKLFAFSGRTRKPQVELAARLGLTEYAQPAGGCVLTDESFARRWQDLIARVPEDTPLRFPQVVRLRLGRHFRLPGGGKVIIGRNARENEYLLRYREDLPWVLSRVLPGPVALVDAGSDGAARAFALGAAARYTDAPSGTPVPLEWHEGEATSEVAALALSDEELAAVRL